MRGMREVENDLELEVARQDGVSIFKPHWQIFVPTIVIFVGYSLSLVYLWATDRNDSSLFRLFSIVAAVGVPLLAAHAFLRYETVRLKLGKNSLRYHPGWPKDRTLEIPFDLIENIRAKRGIAGRLFGGGTLIIETSTGGRISIADLRDPEGVLEHFPQDRWDPAV